MPSIMIVDDSAYSRALLKQQLATLGHVVLEASDGQQAWERIQSERINIVITDWIMPNMSGLELCRLIRAANFRRYVYIILLTIKDERDDMVTGIAAGADNFLVKPCSLAQLRVMLFTAMRVLKYEAKLLDRNRRLARAHAEQQRSLRAVGDFHQALLPIAAVDYSGIRICSRSMPCEFATGDMFNHFPLGDDHLAFYLLDVEGHGVPAAMLSFTLSHFLSSISHGAAAEDAALLDLRAPVEVTSWLNRRFQARSDDWRSFTLIYGVIERRERRVRYCQAGHPPLILQRLGEPARPLEGGGLPVGCFEDAVYEEFSFAWQPGDRVYIYSDGVTECRDSQEQTFTVSRLTQQLDDARASEIDVTLDMVLAGLRQWRGHDHFTDDVSLLGIEFLEEDP